MEKGVLGSPVAEERSCEDTGRRGPPTGEGEKPQTRLPQQSWDLGHLASASERTWIAPEQDVQMGAFR